MGVRSQGTPEVPREVSHVPAPEKRAGPGQDRSPSPPRRLLGARRRTGFPRPPRSPAHFHARLRGGLIISVFPHRGRGLVDDPWPLLTAARVAEAPGSTDCSLPARPGTGEEGAPTPHPVPPVLAGLLRVTGSGHQPRAQLTPGRCLHVQPRPGPASLRG